MKLIGFFFFSFIFFIYSNLQASACPICTATMVVSFIIGEMLKINILYIGFLISGIVVSSTDWLFYIYKKNIYFKFLQKIDNFQAIVQDKNKNLKLINLIKLKFKIAKYILVFMIYFINYYSVIKLSKKYKVDILPFYQGLACGFIFSQFAVNLSNFLSRKNIKVIKFQKTAFLLISLSLFIILSKILALK